MATIFFPACKILGKYPEISQKIEAYLKLQFDDLKVESCCKTSLNRITSEDTVIYICTSCVMYVRDNTPAKTLISLWEIIDNDASFVLPNYKGKVVTIQDCWKVPNETRLQDATRNLLEKMKIDVLELENNRKTADFCGKFLYDPDMKQFAKFSKHITQHQDAFFKPHTDEAYIEIMKNHSRKITTDEVVCYCGACRDGLIDGGKSVFHLAELVFS